MNSPNRRRRLNKSRRKKESPAEIESPATDSGTSITDLPETILLHIISFLSTIDAIRVAAVAPPWRHLWRTLPALEFSMIERYRRFRKWISDREARTKLLELVTQTLSNRPRHFPIQVLKIMLFYRNTDQIRVVVDSWIHMIADLKVADLHLEFLGQGKRNKYEFRFSEILNSSIEILRLQGCILNLPRKEVSMCLNSIRELHLGPAIGNAGAIEQLMAACINLEVFVFVFWDPVPDLNIVSASLRHLKISGRGPINLGPIEHQGSTSVVICTPRLESIELVGVCLGMYTITNVPSLVEATVGFDTSTWWDFASWTSAVSSLTAVERLTIHSINLDGDGVVPCKTYEDIRQLIIEEESFRDVSKLKFGEEIFSETFFFLNLKILTLTTRYSEADILSLESILKKSPQLHTLVLVCYGYIQIHDQLMDDEIADSPIVLQIPRLREVRMERYMGTKNELFVVDLLKKFGVVLEKITAFPAARDLLLPPPFLL